MKHGRASCTSGFTTFSLLWQESLNSGVQSFFDGLPPAGEHQHVSAGTEASPQPWASWCVQCDTAPSLPHRCVLCHAEMLGHWAYKRAAPLKASLTAVSATHSSSWARSSSSSCQRTGSPASSDPSPQIHSVRLQWRWTRSRLAWAQRSSALCLMLEAQVSPAGSPLIRLRSCREGADTMQRAASQLIFQIPGF